MGRLKEGTVTLVTGAGRGVGREIAITFAREGSDMVLAARSEEDLRSTADIIESLGRRVLICLLYTSPSPRD